MSGLLLVFASARDAAPLRYESACHRRRKRHATVSNGEKFNKTGQPGTYYYGGESTLTRIGVSNRLSHETRAFQI
jgi:hypothetical protein